MVDGSLVVGDVLHKVIPLDESIVAVRGLRGGKLLTPDETVGKLLAAAERHAQERDLLDRVRTALERELDLPVLFRAVVKAIADTFGYTQVSLYLLDGDHLVLQQQVGYDQVLERIPVEQGVMGRAARTREPVLLENVRTAPDFLGAIEGIVSEVCVPFCDQGQVMGVLNEESTGGVRLTAADLELMLAVSEYVSIAIGRARRHTKSRPARRASARWCRTPSTSSPSWRPTGPSATRALPSSGCSGMRRTNWSAGTPLPWSTRTRWHGSAPCSRRP